MAEALLRIELPLDPEKDAKEQLGWDTTTPFRSRETKYPSDPCA